MGFPTVIFEGIFFLTLTAILWLISFSISPHHNFALKCCNNNCIIKVSPQCVSLLMFKVTMQAKTFITIPAFIGLITTVFNMVSNYAIFLYKTFITVIASIDFLILVYALILFHLKLLKKLFTKVTLIWFFPSVYQLMLFHILFLCKNFNIHIAFVGFSNVN